MLIRISLVRPIVTALSLLLLAGPAVADDFDWAHPPYLDWADRSEIPSQGRVDDFSKATIEDEPCCTAAKGGAGASAEEGVLLKQLDGRVARDDMVLRLSLEGGRTLTLTDCIDDDVCIQPEHRRHRLAGWWPASRYYLVKVEGYGLYQLLLISQKDGRTTQVPNVPILSPSGRYAVALLTSPVLSVRLAILDFTADPPKKVSVARPTCAGVRLDALLRPNPAWIDDSHVRFEGDPDWPGYAGDALYTGKQLLRIGPGRPQWEC